MPVVLYVIFLFFFFQSFSHGSRHIRHYGFGKTFLDICINQIEKLRAEFSIKININAFLYITSLDTEL